MTGPRQWMNGWKKKLSSPLNDSRAAAPTPADDEAETRFARQVLDEQFTAQGDYVNEQSMLLCEANYDAALGTVDIEPFLESAAKVAGDDATRAEALIRIGLYHDEPRALELMIHALSAPSPLVRAAAARGLLHYRDVDSVPALARTVMQDESGDVRWWAATALGLLKSPDAVPALMNRYERGEARDQAVTILALGNIHDPRSRSMVEAALFHDSERVRRAAQSAMATYDFEQRNQGKPGLD